ncbi:MAG TPA: Lrp/AsnC family transcriptional regulator [Candidatus Dormibacteraeota bacterium]|nr:Lrp/AsnC family transcriptional regulator [Candidatus Dormibacteraeota bacterium]
MGIGTDPHDVLVKPLPHLTDSDTSGVANETPQGPLPALDPVDLEILVLLLRDARRSVRGIAAEVGMSAPAVAERIARLERHGVIRGYRAEIDWCRLGYGLLVYVRITGVQGSEQSETVARLRKLPEVEQVEVVTGDSDLLVRLRARDQQHLRDVLFERVWKISGIERTETLLCLGELPPKSFDLELIESLLHQVESLRSAAGTDLTPILGGRRV